MKPGPPLFLAVSWWPIVVVASAFLLVVADMMTSAPPATGEKGEAGGLAVVSA